MLEDEFADTLLDEGFSEKLLLERLMYEELIPYSTASKSPFPGPK